MHVRGIPGSGKTWLCQKAQKLGIKCIDTDDIVSEAFTELYSSSVRFRHLIERDPLKGEPLWHKQVVALGRRLVRQELECKGEPVIIVGITLGRFPGTKSVFIKLNSKELEQAYRRLVAREVHKVIANEELIMETAAKQPVSAVAVLIEQKINQAVKFILPFAEYKRMYKGALKSEKQYGSLILSQKEILKLSNRTCS